MKNRILSFALALVMVLALVPAAVVSSAAEDHGAINVTMGTVTGAPGDEVLVPVYVQVEDMQGAEGLVNFQARFDIPAGLTLTVNSEVSVTNGAPAKFTNVADSIFGFSADPSFNAFVAPASAVSAKGGVAILYLAVEIGADVADGTVLPITVTGLDSMKLGTYTAPKTLDDFGIVTSQVVADGYTANYVAGSVTVSTAGITDAPANDEEVDFYAIPEYVDGAKVTSISKNGVQGGTYGTLYVPASVVYVVKKSCTGEVTDALILKNTDAFDGYDLIVDMAEEATIYYHKLANGTDTMYDTIIEDDYENELVNILGGGVVVNDNNVTAYGTIRVEDLAYDYVTVEVVIGDRTFTEDFTTVATTLTLDGKAVVSTSAGAVELGAADGEGVYVFGLTVTGVPAGTYDVAVNVYGSTASSNGTSVLVCADAFTTSVTVK